MCNGMTGLQWPGLSSLFVLLFLCCRGGVQVRMFFSVQQDEVYIKVRASTSRLKLEAARTGYKVRQALAP